MLLGAHRTIFQRLPKEQEELEQHNNHQGKKERTASSCPVLGCRRPPRRSRRVEERNEDERVLCQASVANIDVMEIIAS